MKVVTLALVLGMGLASGASISMDCAQANASSVATPIPPGNANAICPAIIAAGATSYNFVLLEYKYDAGFGFGTGSVSFTHDAIPALNAFDDLTPQVVTDATGPFTSSIQVNAPSAAVIAALAAGNTINLAWTNTSGSVGVVSGDFRWTIDYNTAVVPEPASMGLMGASLLVLGFISRRYSRKA